MERTTRLRCSIAHSQERRKYSRMGRLYTLTTSKDRYLIDKKVQVSVLVSVLNREKRIKRRVTWRQI